MSDDGPLSVPAAPATLVGYQDGAVVSRTLLKTSGGSVTLFAFAAGQGLSEHTTPHDATVLVLDGRAEVTVADRVETVAPGELFHLPAGVPHALHAAEPFKMLLTMLRRSPEAAS